MSSTGSAGAFAKLAYLMGRAARIALRRGRNRPRSLETGVNGNGCLPAFVFSGCDSSERLPTSTAARSNDATVGDLIEILENGVAKKRPSSRRKRA
jgi:hypothetical protein